MTTATNPYPNIAPPAGARAIDAWQNVEPQPYRVVIGDDRTVTDHKLRVSPTTIQLADGSIDDGTTVEAPSLYVFDLDEGNTLNSDQARELASVLIEAADLLDEWASR